MQPAGSRTIYFGNVPEVATISGKKFRDDNRNETQEYVDNPPSGNDFGDIEPGLENWTIELVQNGTVIQTTTTDANGDYSFTNLDPGTYTVREVLISPYIPTTSVSVGGIILSAGEARTDVNFGNFLGASISGTKFRDDNRNMIQDGEPGLENWTIELVQNGTVIQTTTTDANGDYEFLDLQPGNYTVSEVEQEGFTATTNVSVNVTLSAGQARTNVDFGNASNLGSISGIKFRDRNLPLPNEEHDVDEELLNGWTIQLAENRNFTSILNSKVTGMGDAQGHYTFPNLQPGTYYIREVPQDPDNIEQTTMPVVEVTLGPGENLTENQNPELAIGNRRDGQIIGEMFEDKNGNGVKNTDIGERGIEGIRVYLNRDVPRVSDTGVPDFVGLDLQLDDVSSQTGGYNFPNLDAPLNESDVPETYKVSVLTVADQGITPNRRVFTATTRGPSDTTIELDYYLTSEPVRQADFPGGGLDPYLDENVDFGFIEVVNISEVDNLDEAKAIRGFQDGVNVLELPDGVSPSNLTFARGLGANNGNVEVRSQSDPNRLIAVLVNVPTTATIDASDFTASSSGGGGGGGNGGGNGGGTSGSVSGVAFLDSNSNGTRNAGEIGFPNITVYLDSNSNGVLDNNERTAVTGSDGSYSFSNVDSNLLIRAVTRPGFVQTTSDGQAAAGNVNFGFGRAIQGSRTNQATSTVGQFDELTGTPGRRDLFLLKEGKIVNIEGFVDREDRLVLRDGLTFADLEITAGTGSKMGNTLISMASSDEVIAELMGIEPTIIGQQDFISI